MLTRRTFLRTVAAGGAAMALTPSELLSSVRSTTSAYFGVHPFIESHPDAVFIFRTSVDTKTNSTAVRTAGNTFGSSVFVPMATPGIPISHRVVLKPNIVMMPVASEANMGIVTDPYFVEGVIESIKTLGVSGSQFYLREVNDPAQFANSGYAQMATRTGADLRKLNDPVGTIAESELQWIDVPNGEWFTRIPYLWPMNAPDTWLLNIAKMKTHLMGMSLCAKNIQGAIAIPYVQHCSRFGIEMPISASHVRPGAWTQISSNYQNHLQQGIPRWDKPGDSGGIWQETWGTRCMDNNRVTHAGLNIIEAVYGREGPFQDGPAPDGSGIDHMMNLVIFGKNPFHVDAIGLWLGGHEPGNFGYLHMARERGLSSVMDPSAVQLFAWDAAGTATPASLQSYDRTPLRTQYLQKNYGGGTEAEWHLVNEPYNYTSTGIGNPDNGMPRMLTLHQNFPNPFNPSTSITFDLPAATNVRIDVANLQGQIVEVLVDGFRAAGSHLVRWDGSRQATGVYICRAMAGGRTEARTMVLIR